MWYLFWSSIRMFWTSEEVENWKQAVLGEKGTENCSNLITLSATAHIYWGKRCLVSRYPQINTGLKRDSTG